MIKTIKQILVGFFPVIPAGIILGTMIFSHSCANTTTPPSGGPKDTIPPVLVWTNPAPGATMVPTSKPKIEFAFNEYVKVKSPKSIYLSPPLDKTPKSKLKGKSVIVYYDESDLEPNTTYTLDLNDAIVDNNEGNQYAGYTLVFSTGKHLDSMAITGIVRDCNTLKPIKDATVMLFKDHADSAIFKHRPSASAKTDAWGFFVIRNIQDTLYRLYAIKDVNNDNIYNPETELIAFCDSLVRPTINVRDSLKELMKFDMKDTASCLSRKPEYELNMFREKPSKQMLMNRKRVSERTSYITFMAPNTQIDSIWFKGMNPDRLITQFNLEKDSLEIWINDQRRMPDTLHLFVDYMKTDSLGELKPTLEDMKLTMETPMAVRKSSRRNIKHEDTTCVFKAKAEPERIEQYGFEFEFEKPLVKANFDTLQFTYINPRQKEYKADFTAYRDKYNIRKYTIKPELKLRQGYEYILKIPEKIFMDIDGHYNDSSELKVTLPKDEDLSSLNIKFNNVHERYIIDLLNEKRNEVLRSFIINKDQTVQFPYLKKGKYSVRITEDINKNDMVDTGCLLEHRQPEKVKFFKIAGEDMIEIPARMDINQEIDMNSIFRDEKK